MDQKNIISNLKSKGYVNIGKILSDKDINELSKLCRDKFKSLNSLSTTNKQHKDILSSSSGSIGFTRVPEHNPKIEKLLNKVVIDPKVIRILKEVLGNDYKIWQIVYRKSIKGDKGLQLHQDSYGETNLTILLSDNNRGFGSTVFLSGTHLLRKSIKEFKIMIPRFIFSWILIFCDSLRGKKGDVGFFFNSTWHGRSPNNSSKEYDVILFSFFPATGKFGFNGYGNWSEKFLKKNTSLTTLINPKVNTRIDKHGLYEVLSKKNFKLNKPFVLHCNQTKLNIKKYSKFKLFFSLGFLITLSRFFMFIKIIQKIFKGAKL